jgi:hypothetical protein
LDVNRNEEFAFPLGFPPELAEEMKSRLLIMHRAAMEAIRAVLDATTSARLVFDIHTMSPGSPIGPAPKTAWNTLPEHVAYWARAAKEGVRRPTDIIDSLDTGEIIGNHELAVDLGEACKSLGLTPAFNTPYAKSEKHHPIDLVSGHGKSGVSIDFTKDAVASSPDGAPFDLRTCVADEGKIAAVVQGLKEVLVKHL